MLMFGSEYPNGAGTTLTGCNINFCDALHSTYGCVGSINYLLGMHHDGSQQEVLCTKDEKKLRSRKSEYSFIVGKYQSVVKL